MITDVSSYASMVQKLAKPGEDIVSALKPSSANLLHMAIGISGEVAELIEALRDDGPNIGEELGDCEFFFEGFQQGVDFYVTDSFNNGIYEGYALNLLIEELVICAGNLLDKAKRLAIYNKPLDDERGEIYGFIQEFRSLLTCIYSTEDVPVTVEDAKFQNMEKLLTGKASRYSSGTYSDEQANARADKLSS